MTKMVGAIKISIIIPIYNAEKYLKRCLNSLITQSLNDIEIICINDGSTDSSLKILEEYAKNDKRIKLYSQINSGQGMARNYGINLAQGEYISFIDADDFIDKDFCLNMYNRAKEDNTEITMCCVRLYDDEKENYLPDNDKWILSSLVQAGFLNKCFSFEDTKKYYFDQILGVPWNKIYKTNFIKENNLKFPEYVKSEDYPFFYDAWIKINRANICYEKLYNYRQNNLLSDSNTTIYGCNFIKHFETIEQIIKNAGYWDELRIPFLNKKISGLEYCYNRTAGAYKENLYESIKEEYLKMDLDESTLKMLNKSCQTLYFEFKNFSFWFLEYFIKTLRRIFAIKMEHKEDGLWLQIFGIKTKVRK